MTRRERPARRAQANISDRVGVDRGLAAVGSTDPGDARRLMSYLDPQGVSGRHARDRTGGDQRQPEWAGADDSRWDDWTTRYDTTAPYPATTSFQPPAQPHPRDTRPEPGPAPAYRGGRHQRPDDDEGYDARYAPDPYPGGPYDTGADETTRHWSPRHRSAEPEPDPRDPSGYAPRSLRPSGYEPSGYLPDGHPGARYEPGAHRAGDDWPTQEWTPRPEADPYRGPDPYQPEPYQPEPYQPEPYQPDRDPYQPDHDGDAYRAGPHGDGYAAGSQAWSRPYPIDDPSEPTTAVQPRVTAQSGITTESGITAPTDPIGWEAVTPKPPRPAPHHAPTAGIQTDPPPADPYADTQTLPRMDSESAPEPDRGPDGGPDQAAVPQPPSAAQSGTGKSSTGRAGRNLRAAIGVGVALGALVLVSLFVYRPAFLVVIAVAASIGTWELARAVQRGSGANPPLPPLVAGGLLMVGLAWWIGPDALTLALLVTVLAAAVWRLGDGPRGFQRDLTAAALVAVYVPFLGGFAALLATVPTDGHLRVLVTLAAVVLSDTGGYVAGVLLGKHPMAPSVSPKKSWEGFAGSVLATAAGSALLLWLLFDLNPAWGALFGAAISIAAVLGDLAESMIKRDLGIKDMSNLLPGHGGLMDRLDSILFAVPIAYLLLTLLVPTG